MRHEEKVLSLLTVFTLLPLKNNLVTFLVLEFIEATSMSSENPCQVFWEAYYFKNDKNNGLKTKDKIKRQAKTTNNYLKILGSNENLLISWDFLSLFSSK